ncbi:MAG: hypothetical protein HYY37_03155 [Candidatus Aenigmarchaeota archaeon]|nr:hypothetical protein [Candidatus Aenigmarchaeota archaeon]
MTHCISDFGFCYKAPDASDPLFLETTDRYARLLKDVVLGAGDLTLEAA